MWHEIKNIFHFIILFQCIVFIFFLLSQTPKKRYSNFIFITFLLSIMLIELGGIAAHFIDLTELIYNRFPQFYYFVFPVRYIYVPLLFLYILSFSKSNFRFLKFYYLHFTPFLIIFFIILFRNILVDPDFIRSYLQTGEIFEHYEKRIYYLIEVIQYLCYFVASLIILKNYRKSIKNYYSSLERINLSWLKLVVFGFIIWKSLLLINSFFWDNYQELIPIYIYIIIYISAELFFLLFLSTMFLKGIKQQEVFFINNLNNTNRKYEKILLTDAQKEEYRKKLFQYMEDKKPYINPSFNLKEFAGNTGIPTHHLSQFLNMELKQNFYDFINLYRINECKTILSNKSSKKFTILEILYESGFNSKSVFNTAFKKHTGMTPTQYRKLYIS